MKRKNWFNNLFFSAIIAEQDEKYNESKKLVGFSKDLYQDLDEAKTLEQILDTHKKAWELGYRNENIGPCPWGMFRTASIPEMTIDEVFLGDIWGLSTRNIRFWNENANETMAGNGFNIPDYVKVYDVILSQYRKHLLSNIRCIVSEAQGYILDYEEFVL